MELFCEKYKQKMDSEGAVCRHPTEYCKFRASCMIHFLTKETVGKREENKVEELDRRKPDGK